MGFLELVKLLLALLPEVMGAVRAIEVAVPQAGAGAQKLNAVLSTVQAATLAAPAVLQVGTELQTAVKVGDVPNIETGLSHMIGAVVNLFNATGAFQKSGLVQAVNAAADAPGATAQD